MPEDGQVPLVDDNDEEKLKATKVALAVTFLFTVGKMATGWWVDSLAIIAVAVDSGLDLLAAVFNHYLLRLAAEPPDKDHPYGHGKWESLAALLQAVFIFGAGGTLVYKSVQLIIAGKEMVYSLPGMAVVALGIFINLLLVRYMEKTAEKTRSSALRGQATNYRMDLYSNTGVLVGLVLVKLTGQAMFDPIASLIVSLGILWSGYDVFTTGLSELLDRSLPASIRKMVAEVLEEHEHYHGGIHSLRTRRVGTVRHVDFHLTLCKGLTVAEADEIVHHIEDELEAEISPAEIVIHLDGCTDPDCDGKGKVEDDCLQSLPQEVSG